MLDLAWVKNWHGSSLPGRLNNSWPGQQPILDQLCAEHHTSWCQVHFWRAQSQKVSPNTYLNKVFLSGWCVWIPIAEQVLSCQNTWNFSKKRIISLHQTETFFFWNSGFFFQMRHFLNQTETLYFFWISGSYGVGQCCCLFYSSLDKLETELQCIFSTRQVWMWRSLILQN